MPRKSDPTTAIAGQAVVWAIQAVRRNPRRNLPLILGLLAFAGLVYWLANRPPALEPSPAYESGKPGEFLLCFWNVENLFDDRPDKRLSVDEPYDNWFARNSTDRQLKLHRLSEALLKLNGGKGPDILACCEVESVRAAELLRDALNAGIPDANWHYKSVLMKEVAAGRHIAPAVITRLPVRENLTRLIGSKLRILETHIDVNGYELVLVASHWTSHVSDQDGSGGRRDKYAETIYNLYRDNAIRNPEVDFLVCGDFNDSPQDASVRTSLHTTGDRTDMTADAIEPKLLNLMAGKDPGRFGTYYHTKLLIYDQIVVSRGMLDAAGWGCDPDTVSTVNTLVRPGSRTRAPWRFGNEKDDTFERGYSDHFPVTVRLRVQGKP